MSGNALKTVRAKILAKGCIAMQFEIDGKIGWLQRACIEFDEDVNSISVDQVIELRVPEWLLVKTGFLWER